MKKILFSALASTLLISCGSSEAVKTEDVKTTTDSTHVEVTTKDAISTVYKVVNEKSVLGWSGSAVGKSHNGTVDITKGSLTVSNGVIISGDFVFDMTSINSLDLEGEWKEKLEGHLSDSTFFSVKEFPTAKLKINGYAEGNIIADLTIRDVTKSIKFPSTVTVAENGVDATAKFTINRTDFGVVYGSGSLFDLAKDKAISDDIDFDISIQAIK